MSSTLRTGTALYASAHLVDRLLGLLLLPLLTRAISPGDYGAWTQTAVFAGILMPVVLLATPTAIVRSFSGTAAPGLRWRRFVQLGVLSGAMGSALGVAALAGRDAMAALVWGDAAAGVLVPALLVWLAADSAYDYALAWLRAAGRMAVISALLTARSALRFATVSWLVRDGGTLAGWIDAYAAVQAVLAACVLAATAAMLRRAARRARAAGAARVAAVPLATATATATATAGQGAGADAGSAAPPSPRIAELLAFSVPLVALALFTAFSASFDRFLLVRLLGLDAVAVYSAAASLAGIPALFYTVLGFTLFPVLARHWAAGHRDEAARLTSVALEVYAFLCLPVAFAIAIAGPLLLPLLSTARYQPDPLVFVLLGAGVSAFGLYQILLYPMLLDGRSRQVLGLSLAAATVNAVLNLLLVPRFGAVGAAAAAAAAPATMVAFAAAVTRRLMPWRFPAAALAAIAARAAAGVLPLGGVFAVAAAVPGGAVHPVAAAVALGVGAAAYLVLDWRGPGSVARMLLAR